jgi:uncharacterized protein (TIGR02246 family)
MQGQDLEGIVQDYLEAFERRDRSRCMEFFAEDATINFALGVYRGRQAIEEWHDDRFRADLRVLRVENVRVQGDTATVDAIATSKVAKAWRVNSVAGTVTLVFRGGKIQEGKFHLRTRIPLEGW